jgi:hypothetical protein
VCLYTYITNFPGYSPPQVNKKGPINLGLKVNRFLVGMWFMRDAVPLHFSCIARQYMNDHFPGKWIGRNWTVPLPLRSPDLNPIF